MDIPQIYSSKPLVHAWEYLDPDDRIIGIVGRYQNGADKKEIIPFFKQKGAGWKAGIDSESRPLFGLNLLAQYPKQYAVFIVEGEKAAAALQSIGVVSLTSLGGSKAASKADWTPLNGYNKAYLLPDNDEPGESYINDVVQALSELEFPPELKILRLPNLPVKGDVVDWLQTLSPDWNGYDLIPETEKDRLKTEFKRILGMAETYEGNLAGLAGSHIAYFENIEPGIIETKDRPVPVLPESIIPEPYRDWISDIAYRMQTPPDFAAVSAITIIGSVIGAGCAIRPKQKDDWEVIPNLWGACIGRPSVVLKSPSMKEPAALLDRLQAEAGEVFEQAEKDYEFVSMANEAMLKDIKENIKKAAKGKGIDSVVDSAEMLKCKTDYDELTQQADSPVRRLFKTSETSIQSQTVLQNENPRGILTFRDELTALLSKWDRADHEDERAYFLEGWNGNGTYTDYKIGRGLTDAKNICISLLGGIQPDKLKRYLYQAQKGNNDGLMQRLQLAVWPDEPKNWELIDTHPNHEEKQRAVEIMRLLADMDFTQYGAVKGEYDDRPYFRFDDTAQAVFNQWLIELQTVKLKNEENPLMVEHFGKYRSLMPSLALIFHLIDIADGKESGRVTEKSALLSVQWCEYLEDHARRMYSMAESPEQEAAVNLSKKIKEGQLPNPFTAKYVYDKGWHLLKDRQEAEAACNILIDENWLQIIVKPRSKNGGRPPLPEYFINPKCTEYEPAKPAKGV